MDTRLPGGTYLLSSKKYVWPPGSPVGLENVVSVLQGSQFVCLFVFAVDDTQPSMGFVVKPLAAVGILVAVGALVKWYFGGAVCRSKARLEGINSVGLKLYTCCWTSPRMFLLDLLIFFINRFVELHESRFMPWYII